MKVCVFNILVVFVFSAMFSPSFISNTSYRIDTILIYLLVPFLILYKPKLYYLSANRYILISVGTFVFTIFIALFLQSLLISDASLSKHFINFAGFFRILLFSILALISINSYDRALMIAKILLICIILQSIILIIEYTQIFPFSYLINLIYHDSNQKLNVYRATGSFSSVHAAAYFFLYSLLFSFAICITVSNKKIKNLSIVAIFFSLVGVILPVSKSAYIALLASLVFLIVLRRDYKTLLLTPILLSILIFSIYVLIPKKKLEYFVHDLSQLQEGITWFFLSRDKSYDEIGFIAGRLNHGWKNAIDNWFHYPIYGNIDTSEVIFIGDGGYTEILTNSGAIGLIGFLLMLLFIYYQPIFITKYHYKISSNSLIGIRSIVIAIVFASVATGFAKQRTLELLPIFFLTLSTLSVKTNSINTCNKYSKLS